MKIGFIGCGNMASAMICGILESGAAVCGEVMASAKSAATQKKITDDLKIMLGGICRHSLPGGKTSVL